MKKLLSTIIFALGIGMVGMAPSYGASSNLPTQFEKLQQIATEFNHAKKPLSLEESTQVLERALQVLDSNSFDNEYQDIRANAFDKQNWTQADKITHSLSPLFTVTFDGDSDVYQINGYILFSATQNVSGELKQKCRSDMYCNLKRGYYP